jgi:Bacterial extracellular solute-binding protein
VRLSTRPVYVLLLAGLFVAYSSYAAAPSPALVKAKSDAEARGYLSAASHGEIVANAKKEARLRIVTNMEPANFKASVAGFMKRYPFIDVQVQEITGAEEAQRNLLEIKRGAKNYDVHRLSTDFYNEYLPYLFKVDILGMAQQGVLQIPPAIIDPKNRNALALLSFFQVTAYNKDLVPANRLPATWDDLLRPEFKAKKFAADIRPQEIAGLVPAWGVEKTLDFARKLALQQPIWVRGSTRAMTAIIAGEIPMMIGPNFNSTKRIQAKDKTGLLQYVILEPVPLRPAEIEGIQANSESPYAALLWFEWMASPEAQRLVDEFEPFASSYYIGGGAVEQALRGRKLSVVGWEQNQLMEAWQAEVVKAYGFPKVESK